jgi:hypothetical protein
MGRKLSEETKRKISEAAKGRKASPEARRKNGEAHKGQIPWIKGKKHTTDALSKMSRTWFRKGATRSPNWYKAMAARRGVHRPAFSSEWCANMSRSRIGRISSMKGRHFGDQARANMASASRRRLLGKRGPNTPRWVADRTQLKTGSKHDYNSLYKYWMLEVKRRDAWKCRIADENCSGRLEAHHILPWARFSELRYKLNNGITLCHYHHPHTRASEMEMVTAFQELVANAA